jgi:hypothetical protein
VKKLWKCREANAKGIGLRLEQLREKFANVQENGCASGALRANTLSA